LKDILVKEDDIKHILVTLRLNGHIVLTNFADDAIKLFFLFGYL